MLPFDLELDTDWAPVIGAVVFHHMVRRMTCATILAVAGANKDRISDDIFKTFIRDSIFPMLRSIDKTLKTSGGFGQFGEDALTGTTVTEDALWMVEEGDFAVEAFVNAMDWISESIVKTATDAVKIMKELPPPTPGVLDLEQEASVQQALHAAANAVLEGATRHQKELDKCLKSLDALFDEHTQRDSKRNRKRKRESTNAKEMRKWRKQSSKSSVAIF